MLFLQSVRLAADGPHVCLNGDWLWSKAAAWSGCSVTTKSAWKRISTQVAPMARTCQWGMLDASGDRTRQMGPAACPSLTYSVHSFAPLILGRFIQQCGQQVRSLSTPGEKQFLEEECNKALCLCPLTLSPWVCVCVCAEEGRWAVLQSSPNKLVDALKGKADSANQSVRYRHRRHWIRPQRRW